MKKVFSILTTVLLLTGTLHVTVARHYCGGELVASKVSLKGSLASCGMERSERNCPLESPGDHMKSHCCDDVVTSYSINDNYTQNQVIFNEPVRFSVLVMDEPVTSTDLYSNYRSQIFTDVSPPDLLMNTAVDLTSICVFRI